MRRVLRQVITGLVSILLDTQSPAAAAWLEAGGRAGRGGGAGRGRGQGRVRLEALCACVHVRLRVLERAPGRAPHLRKPGPAETAHAEEAVHPRESAQAKPASRGVAGPPPGGVEEFLLCTQ